MKHYYENVLGIGNVAVSRHAQEKATEDKITEEQFAQVLLFGKDTPEGPDIVNRELRGIRIVILRRPEPFAGAALVKTAYRIKAQGVARR